MEGVLGDGWKGMVMRRRNRDEGVRRPMGCCEEAVAIGGESDNGPNRLRREMPRVVHPTLSTPTRDKRPLVTEVYIVSKSEYHRREVQERAESPWL